MGKIFIAPGMSMSTIQKAIEQRNANVIFTPGIHKITKPLYIGSDIRLTFVDGAKVQQGAAINNIFMTRVYKTTTGYNGSKNIIIEGLDIEAFGGKYKVPLNLLTLWHALNVTVRGSIFRDVFNFHALEINGCKDVLVESSKFLGYVSDPLADFREQIQIDFSASSAIYVHENGSKCYDNTCCENVIIRDCIFNKSQYRPGASACIGNHAQPLGAHHKKILIEDNKFYGYGTNHKDSCIKLTAMDDVTIRGNYCEGFGRFVYASKKSYSYDKFGHKKDVKPDDGLCRNLVYENNEVVKSTGVYKAWTLYNTAK